MRVPDDQEIRIVEVFPRDGLQVLTSSEYESLTTEQKLDLIENLSNCGLQTVEITNFAHPAVLPQFEDAEAIVREFSDRDTVNYRVVIPNMYGLERAIDAGAEHAHLFLVASETYQRRNVGMTIEENLQELESMVKVAADAGVRHTVGLGMAFDDPFSGPVPEDLVFDIVERLYDMGFREISLADSFGMADPRTVYERCSNAIERWPDASFALHLHDRHGFALANVLAGIQAGIYQFDTAIGGIGGGFAFPDGQKSKGNVSTEEVVRFCHRLGLETGVDLHCVLETARDTCKLFGMTPQSPVHRTGTLDDAVAKYSEE